MMNRIAIPALLAGLLLAGCSSDCCKDCCSPTPAKAESTAPAAAKKDDGAQSLFDGKALGAWKTIDFGGEGPVKVENGAIKVDAGATCSGVQWTGEAPPRTNYEFSVDAMKVDGSDFFLGIVFPVGKETCSFVAGGWGGGVTGLSSVDHMNASENETASDQNYVKNKWYTFRLIVTSAKIEVWWDAKQVVNLELANRQISVHPAVESAAPLGLVNYQTASLFRNIKLKKLK
jgi:3-keto-disaccharide hydrolase